MGNRSLKSLLHSAGGAYFSYYSVQLVLSDKITGLQDRVLGSNLVNLVILSKYTVISDYTMYEAVFSEVKFTVEPKRGKA